MENRACEHLEAIRAYMDRAGRFTNLSGAAFVIAGAAAVAGSAACAVLGLRFHDPAADRARLALVWAGVAAFALAQDILFTVLGARRRGEPAWSELTRTITIAVAPGFFIAAVLTAVLVIEGLLRFLPGVWMLSYGVSIMGLSLFTSAHVRLFGAAFLLAGALSLLFLQEHGTLCMGITFGGFHVLLGAWIALRYRS